MLKELDALIPWLNHNDPVGDGPNATREEREAGATPDLRKVRAFVRSCAGTPEAGGLRYVERGDPNRGGHPPTKPLSWLYTRELVRWMLCHRAHQDFDGWVAVTVWLGPNGAVSGPLPDVLLFFVARLPQGLVGHCDWCFDMFARRRGRGQPRKNACCAACKQALWRAPRHPKGAAYRPRE